MHYLQPLAQGMLAMNEPRQQTPMVGMPRSAHKRDRALQHRAIQAVVRQHMIAMKKVSSYEP